jgi:hypothetical protein
MKKTTRKTGFGMAVAACAYFGASVRPAYATSDCTQWGYHSIGNNDYIVEVNAFGATGDNQECINWQPSGDFTVTANASTQGLLMGYPNILKGFFGDRATNQSTSGVPIKVSDINSWPVTWNITPTSGTMWDAGTNSWNAAIEFWAWTSNPQYGNTNHPDGTELMIWPTAVNQIPAGLPIIRHAAIGGVVWDVRARGKWTDNKSGVYWNYIAYTANPWRTNIDMDLKSFFDDAKTRTGTDANTLCQQGTQGSGNCLYDGWYVSSVQAGFELFSIGKYTGSGVNLTSGGFSSTVNGLTADQYFAQIAVGQNVNSSGYPGRLELFYVDNSALAVNHNYQQSAGGSWSGGSLMGGFGKQLAVARNSNGALDVFYIGTNNVICHNWQNPPGGGWHGEAALGPSYSAKEIAVGQNQDGRLEIFYIGTDNRIYHNWQKPNSQPGDSWNGEAELDTTNHPVGKHIAVGRNANGALDVIYTSYSNNALYHNWQSAPNSGFVGQHSLGGAAKQIAVGQNVDQNGTRTRLELFYVGTDNKIYHNWQLSTDPSASWNGQAVLDANGPLGKHLVVGMNADQTGKLTRMEVFYIGTDNAIYHNWQNCASCGWSGTSKLDAAAHTAKALAVGLNANQNGLFTTMDLFYIGTNNSIYHKVQSGPGGGWNGEVALGGSGASP